MMLKLLHITMAACLAALCATSARAAAAQDLRIENVTIVSPERARPLRNVDVTIHDGRIAAIASARSRRSNAAITTLDGAGLYLTPGLIDSHVHVAGVPGMTDAHEASHPDIAEAAKRQFPRSYLLYGYTTLVDLNSTGRGIARWRAHDPVPDTYFCGAAPVMNGYPTNYAPPELRNQMTSIMPYILIEPGTEAPSGVDAAQHTPAAVVTRMKADGAICVKTYHETGFGDERNLPVPSVETVRQLVRAAHAAGMPVFIHANSSEAQSFALSAGVDVIAHGLWNWGDDMQSSELTPAVKRILDDAAAAGVGWQPTVQVMYGQSDLFGSTFLTDPRLARVLPSSLIDWYRTPEGQWFHDVLAQSVQSMGLNPSAMAAGAQTGAERVGHAAAYLAAHGGRLLFGSDTPSAPTYANPPGLNGWFEMQHLVEGGVTPAQIFNAATLSNARALRLDHDIGTVQVGKRANLLLLRQDPTQTIEAYADIVKVILNGRTLDPDDLMANRSR